MNGEPFLVSNDLGWPIRGEVRRLPDGGGAGTIIVSHGFKGFKDWGFFPYAARRFAEAGHTVVTFNFSGSGIGEKPDEFTEVGKFECNSFAREIADLELVIDIVVERRLAGLTASGPGRLILLGHSRGGLDSLVLAARRPEVRRVVTWAGMGSLEKRFPAAARSVWRRTGYLEVLNTRTGQVFRIGAGALDDLEANWDTYDPLRTVSRLKIPLLMVHGSVDATIPVAEARELASRANPDSSRLVVIPDAGHTFEAVHPFAGTTRALDSAIDATLDFLAG